MKNIAEQFIEACDGNANEAARRIDVSKQLMHHWKNNGVPISRLYGSKGNKTEMHKAMLAAIRKHARKAKNGQMKRVVA